MVKATGLKMWRGGRLQWDNFRAEFHENLPTGSKVISGRAQIDSTVISNTSLSFLKESWLKSKEGKFKAHHM
jgi:hypothetical protein